MATAQLHRVIGKRSRNVAGEHRLPRLMAPQSELAATVSQPGLVADFQSSHRILAPRSQRPPACPIKRSK